MEKLVRRIATAVGVKRPTDLASVLFICTSCALYIHSSNLRSTLQEISVPAPSAYSKGGGGSGHDSAAIPTDAGSRTRVRTSLTLGNRQVSEIVNRTGQAEQPELLVLTKVPRCGASPLGHVLHGLSSSAGFKVWDEDPRKRHQSLPRAPAVAAARVAEMVKVPKPAAVIREISYLNFSLHGEKSPIYVSMLRDPVEQAYSWFYWLRAPFAVIERANIFGKENALEHLPLSSFLKKNFETCLTSDDKECEYKPGSKRMGHPVQAFCTASPECPIFGSREALQESKRVVEEGYAVVGILEDWETSLTVLEKFVPRFFTGASKYYNDVIAKNRTLRNENFYKPGLPASIRAMMEKNFAVELEFYDFVKQRLYRQYESLTA